MVEAFSNSNQKLLISLWDCSFNVKSVQVWLLNIVNMYIFLTAGFTKSKQLLQAQVPFAAFWTDRVTSATLPCGPV
jgi:hypothetical protein